MPPNRLAALFSMCAFATSPGNTGTEPPSRSTIIQLTHGNYMDPSLSPDGRRMVVIAIRGQREQLEILDTNGQNPTPLPIQTFDREDPAWSPDGRYISYVSLENGGKAIHIMLLDGSHDRPITLPGRKAIHPNWSPDSKTLFYSTDDDLAPPRKNDTDIIAVNLATGKAKTVITGGTNTYPSISPDGRHIAYRRIVGDNSEIWTAGINGASPRNVTNNPFFDGWPAWSPDGRRLAFASDRGGLFQIYTMRADGSHVKRVADTDGRATAPKWSADGDRIYFPICRREQGQPHCEVYSARAPSR